MLQEMSIRDTRKAIELVFANHGGGELRIVAAALNLTVPESMRQWLDDPYADENVMRHLLLHPRCRFGA